MSEVRQAPLESLAGFKNMLVENLAKLEEKIYTPGLSARPTSPWDFFCKRRLY